MCYRENRLYPINALEENLNVCLERNTAMTEANGVRNAIPTEKVIPTWCVECRKDVEMISITEAAIIINEPPVFIFNQIENGLLHYAVSGSNNNLYICLNSLMHLNPANS